MTPKRDRRKVEWLIVWLTLATLLFFVGLGVVAWLAVTGRLG
jgi:hypothetical protein